MDGGSKSGKMFFFSIIENNTNIKRGNLIREGENKLAVFANSISLKANLEKKNKRYRFSLRLLTLFPQFSTKKEWICVGTCIL